MSKKNKEGAFSLLRQILAEQKKQTKILQAIESSQEQYKTKKYLEVDSVTKSIAEKPEGSMKVSLSI